MQQPDRYLLRQNVPGKPDIPELTKATLKTPELRESACRIPKWFPEPD